MNPPETQSGGSLKPVGSAMLETREVLGQPTDFLIEQNQDGQNITITITTVFPGLRFDGRILRSFPPPRHPWPNH
jgi:hypothetical protein